MTRADDTASVRVAFDRPELEQRVLRFRPGRSEPRGDATRDEALFALSGRGTIVVDGDAIEVDPGTAVRVAPGQRYRVETRRGLELVSALVPPAGEPVAGPAVVRLADREAEDATSDREFRVLLDPDSGLTGATQFVGYIPTKRAPEHYHTYDEVIYVLDGEGALHLGGETTAVARGSCIHLSPRRVHCLENTGGGTMRVLGVFRPAGSPAEAYLPDGTLAYYGGDR